MRNYQKLIQVFLLTVFLCACISSDKSRGPATTDSGMLAGSAQNLLLELQNLQSKVSSDKYNTQSCGSVLEKELLFFQNINLPNLDKIELQKGGLKILNQAFDTRLGLHDKVPSISADCAYQTKYLFRLIRAVEDYVGVVYYGDTQISAESFDFFTQPVPIYEKEKYRPFHLRSGISPSDKFEFKNGDIMITKGKSFISSTISSLPTPSTLFSHIVFVHVDGNKKIETIESYVGVGVGLYPIDYALQNENVRILLFRAKDQVLAAKAADYMYDRAMDAKKRNTYIPYDYELNFDDNTKLSCEEVAYDGFKTMSDKTVIIPTYPARINFSNEDFLKKLGVKRGPMFVPPDMEVEPGFDLVLDWTDYRLIRDSWRKDAVLSELLRWMDQLHYSINDNLTAKLARAAWATRPVPGVWTVMSKLSGIPEDFTSDVPASSISTIANLKQIGDVLLPVVTLADQNYYEKTSKWMSEFDLRRVIDEYRQRDLEIYKRRGKSKLHKLVHAPGM